MLLTAAFLQAGTAAADISDNAFTIDGTTFDPGSDGYNDFAPLVGLAPLLEIGGGIGIGRSPLPTQDLEVYDSSGTDEGTAYTSVNALDLLGIDSSQFTVQAITPPVADIQAALTGSGLDLSGVNVGDLANALLATSIFGPDIPYGSDITGGDVSSALFNTGITLPAGTTDADIAGVLNGIDVSDLPDIGTVYSFTNLGGGFANVYEAVPGSGTAAASITDTLVTPFGNIDIPTTFDAVAHMGPGAAFAGFAATSDNTDVSADAFTLGGTTFDPGSDGFTPLLPLIGVAPLLELGGGQLNFGSLHLPLAAQNLEVYNSSGTDLGSITTGVNTQNLLGIDATQLTVYSSTPPDPGGDTSALPNVGTVYSVTNLGSGYANVYIATPNADGTAAASITDTFVTPNGTFDIPTTYDAIAPMDAGAPFAGLGVTSDASGLSDNAFTIDGTTFDPGSVGFTPVFPLSGIAPLLQIGGGSLGATANLAPQDLDVYGSSGPELGSISTAVNTSSLLGLIDTTQFTVSEYNVPAGDFVTALGDSDINFSGAGFTASDVVNALEGFNGVNNFHLFSGDLTGGDITGALTGSHSGIDLSAAGIDPDDVASAINGEVDTYGADLPDVGTVYSVTDFGSGWENVYEAVPNATGTAASSITDTLVTPFGNIDLSSMFDAIAQLDPGDAAAGVTDAGSAAAGTAAGEGFNLFDPSTWF